MKCSDPMLLAKREAPTGIQCIFLQKVVKRKNEVRKDDDTDLEKNVTRMQLEEKCHLDARKKPVTLPLLLLLAASRPVTCQQESLLDLNANTFSIFIDC